MEKLASASVADVLLLSLGNEEEDLAPKPDLNIDADLLSEL